MGKGDKKTTRGKRIAGSYGKTRPKKNSSAKAIPVKVMDEDEKKASKTNVRKKVGEQTEPTENAEVKKTAKSKVAKTEETATEEKPKTTRKKKTEE